jgi:hypothetical protein
MKRILAAVLFATFTLPVFGASIEQALVDRGLADGPWALDHNFIAPAP